MKSNQTNQTNISTQSNKSNNSTKSNKQKFVNFEKYILNKFNKETSTTKYDNDYFAIFDAINNLKTELKIQKLGLQSIRSILSILYISAIISIIVSTIFSLLLQAFVDPAIESIQAYQAGEALLIFEGVLRFISSLVFIFLFITYPQRIVIDAIKNHRYPLREQFLLIWLMIFYVVNPAFNLWGSINYLISIAQIIEFADGSASRLAIASILSESSTASKITVDILAILSLSATFFFLGAIIHVCGIISSIENKQNNKDHNKKAGVNNQDFSINVDKSHNSIASNKNENNEDNYDSSNINEDDQEDIDENLKSENLYNKKTIRDQTYTRGKRCLKSTKHSLAAIFCNNRCLQFVSVMFNIPPLFSLLIVIYVGGLIASSILLQYSPSQIPIVGIISVLRVCLSTPESYNLEWDPSVKVTESFCAVGSDGFYRAVAASLTAILEMV